VAHAQSRCIVTVALISVYSAYVMLPIEASFMKLRYLGKALQVGGCASRPGGSQLRWP